jgi:hypothetical protein
MPNIWTHLIFGQQVLRMLGESKLIAAPQMKRLFNMGCQGPDFLFYHHFLPWKKGKTMNRLGSAMHTQNCGPAISEMLEAVTGLSASKDTPDPAVVYAIGFVLHHTLDRNIHPYVFSRSGFRKWDHQRFEVMLDTLVARKKLGLETWKTPVWRELDYGGVFPRKIVDAFELIAACCYPQLAPFIMREDWNRANRDMIRAQRLFYDPSGIRRVLTFGQIEPLVYKKETPELDILNESRRPWVVPTDNTMKRDDSFDMMWDKAMHESTAIIRTVLKWLRAEQKANTADDQVKADLRAEGARLIGNRSYETGLPCDSGAEIRFCDPIWPDEQSAAKRKTSQTV